MSCVSFWNRLTCFLLWVKPILIRYFLRVVKLDGSPIFPNSVANVFTDTCYSKKEIAWLADYLFSLHLSISKHKQKQFLTK